MVLTDLYVISHCAYTIPGSHPTRVEALRTRYVNPSFIEGADALLLIGKGETEDQLLLLRYFFQQPIFADPELIFKQVLDHSKGYVARRTGGSAGPTAFSRDFFDFLSQPGTLPRKTVGTVVIKTTSQYFIYYCSPYEEERTVVCAHYWQPHRGGKCYRFPPSFIDTHSGLRSFASSKIATAFLLKAMEPKYTIASEAVSLELFKVKASIEKGGALGSILFFDEYIGTHCEHTVVCHAVGYHNDVFRNGSTNYLENRVVMDCPSYARRVEYPLGRGGSGNGIYTWALLDW